MGERMHGAARMVKEYGMEADMTLPFDNLFQNSKEA
jgi:hypothetical protein